MGKGLIGALVAGAVVGAGATFAAPMVSSKIPAIGPLAPMTVAVLGTGLVAKTVLHKGGNFATAAVMLGGAMAATDLMRGTATSGGTVLY